MITRRARAAYVEAMVDCALEECSLEDCPFCRIDTDEWELPPSRWAAFIGWVRG